jgi:hypothetical protein
LYDIGETPIGTVHLDQLGGGSFEGPRLQGEVLAGGMDQKVMRADGAFQPNVRLILRTDDDALIYMHYTGVRHGPPDIMDRVAAGEIVDSSAYYLRNAPFFHTAAAQYDWLNRIVSAGVGRREADHAVYGVFEIL